MELDVKRLKLDPGFLVNPAGIICKVSPSGRYFCSRKLERIVCGEGSQCAECARVTNSVKKLGRYKNVL